MINKNQLVQQVATNLSITTTEVDNVIDEIQNLMLTELANKNGRVQLGDIGTFSSAHRSTQKYKPANNKGETPITIPGKKDMRFKSGTVFRTLLNP